jgi:hypothetical protein
MIENGVKNQKGMKFLPLNLLILHESGEEGDDQWRVLVWLFSFMNPQENQKIGKTLSNLLPSF